MAEKSSQIHHAFDQDQDENFIDIELLIPIV